MRQWRLQKATVTITAANQTQELEVETDRNYKDLTEVQVTLNDLQSATGLIFSKALTVNDQVVIDEQAELKLFASGTDVAPHDRFYKLKKKEPAAGSKVKFQVQDGGGFAITGAYDVNIYFMLENHKDMPQPAGVK